MKTTALRLTIALLLLLIALCLAWELRLAPLRPGGSWAMLKALPLLAPLPGLLRGSRYTAQWALMLVLPWFCEGVVRAWSDVGPAQALAALEIALVLLFQTSAILFVRADRRSVVTDRQPPGPAQR